jgi:D-alanyl-D-alanine carboxypeptidase/D-alanyl-D-alanine-endopeptidase (penicillin-binding protein 4)
MKIFLPFLILAFSFLTAAPCDHATISIYAVDTTTGEVLRDENSDKSLIPGSCMKIVTTAAALHLLGPEGRFQTDLEYDGTIDQGVLHGNIYIRGGGDPCLGSDRISSSLSWDKQIEAWAAAIQQLGIQKIEGDVFGDAAKWEKACAVPSWAWEDLGNYYGAGASALTFHENMYALFFTPGKEVGAAAAIARTDPVISTIAFQNEVTTGPVGSGDQACIFGSELSSVHAVRGTVPAGVDEFSIKGAIPDPAKYCAQLLSQGLAAKGIAIGHKNVQPGKRTVFHATYSPTVKEIVHRTNQKSHNLYAEHLMKKIGEIVNKEGSTAAGTRAIAAFWGEQNIDLGGFNMADGSGLSRKNLVTAKQLVSILLQMKKSDLFPIFLESLPQQNEMIRA